MALLGKNVVAEKLPRSLQLRETAVTSLYNRKMVSERTGLRPGVSPSFSTAKTMQNAVIDLGTDCFLRCVLLNV